MTIQFDLITLFPDFFQSPLQCSLLGKALKKGIANVSLTNPRNFATDKHQSVDDEPYGGGVGMLLKPEPLFAAVGISTCIAEAGNNFNDTPRGTAGSTPP